MSNLNIPAWIEQDITLDDIKAIQQGGCASGAYMPAVTYHQALETMNEHGNDVLEYIEERMDIVDMITPQGATWSGIAVHYLSTAVELWASSIDESDFTKEVEYFGETVTVPHDAEFLAMDSDGELYAFTEQPEAGYSSWHAACASCYTVEHSQDGNDCPFWSHSMVEV